MTTLAANSDRVFEEKTAFNDRGVIAADIVYAGAACTDDGNGYIKPLGTGEVFAGFAERKADNSGGSAGAVSVRLLEEGVVILSVANVASVADENEPVYATDDDTFTNSSGGSSVQIGKVTRWITGTTCAVFFQAANRRSI